MARIAVRVIPGARENTVVGWQDNMLRIRVRANPERGKANEAVCRLVAGALGLPTGCVTVARGAGSRQKLLEVEGMEEQEVRRRLGAPSR